MSKKACSLYNWFPISQLQEKVWLKTSCCIQSDSGGSLPADADWLLIGMDLETNYSKRDWERKVYWISILYLSRKSASCSSYSHLWPSCNQVLHASDFITSIPLRIGSKLHCSLSLDEKYNFVCKMTIGYQYLLK